MYSLKYNSWSSSIMVGGTIINTDMMMPKAPKTTEPVLGVKQKQKILRIVIMADEELAPCLVFLTKAPLYDSRSSTSSVQGQRKGH